jgi:sarcosine oxidase subunit alpha
MTDVSTLAKFEVTGPDAAALLEKVCATSVSKLAVGRGRYTFMLREDGLVCDDGTVWRLADDRFLLTSSTGGADRMATVLSYARQVLFPELKVSVVNVQEHWAGIAIAGPHASAAVAALIGSEAPRHMGFARAAIAGVPVLLLAASYSGERAFEIYVEATHAAPVWLASEGEVLAREGCIYGLEAMEVLRIEKGHVVVGGEADGRRSPHDLGLDKMLNRAGGYIGEAGSKRPALAAPDRLQLVGLEATGGTIPEGAMLLPRHNRPTEGHVTASAYRAVEGGSIALALLAGGAARHGEELLALSPTRKQQAWVRVTSPHFYDPAGERYRD